MPTMTDAETPYTSTGPAMVNSRAPVPSTQPVSYTHLTLPTTIRV